MKGRSSESLNLNAQLDNISSSLQTIFKKHEFDEDLTLDKIKSIFLGKNKVKTTFVEFYDKYLEDIKAQVVQVRALLCTISIQQHASTS